ncbi:site-specific DNA-adenine methylase [Solibacillus kalamii]|uniref:hypothetical protein n=1 Tax=Solibacillus kalamii TaxID=1748298 RepID=UPI001302CA4A|nr:hypothetical protein [Solibacillus kalamii]MBM7666501.1 site-specific DNA-adenine methylase [Solibacillus kalamii]
MEIPRFLHYPGSNWSMTDWIVSHMPFDGSLVLVVESERGENRMQKKSHFLKESGLLFT